VDDIAKVQLRRFVLSAFLNNRAGCLQSVCHFLAQTSTFECFHIYWTIGSANDWQQLTAAFCANGSLIKVELRLSVSSVARNANLRKLLAANGKVSLDTAAKKDLSLLVPEIVTLPKFDELPSHADLPEAAQT
jgi:hypothetical protein